METITNINDLYRTGVISKSLKSDGIDGVIYGVERQILTPVLSKMLYDAFIIQKKNNNITKPYKYLLDNFIIFAVAHRVKGDLMIDLTFNLKTQGIAQNASDKIYTMSLKDVQELERMCKEESKWYLDEMVNYIEANIELYPEFRVAFNKSDIITSIDKYKSPLHGCGRRKRGCL